MIFKLTLLISGLVQILEQIDKFNLKPDPAKGLVKGAALIVSIMPKDQVPYHIHRHIIIINNQPSMFCGFVTLSSTHIPVSAWVLVDHIWFDLNMPINSILEQCTHLTRNSLPKKGEKCCFPYKYLIPNIASGRILRFL